jgi:Flp pilus assembly protein TadB
MPQQTRRKRRTKHRGNAAGMVEARGRTGRKLTDAERGPSGKGSVRMTSQERRDQRLNTPPSWRSAIIKAGIAALLFAVAVTLFFGQPIVGAIGLALFTFLLYVPLSYYTDRLVYRRHQKRKARG